VTWPQRGGDEEGMSASGAGSGAKYALDNLTSRLRGICTCVDPHPVAPRLSNGQNSVGPVDGAQEQL
jgi:hypothetical protein